MKRRAFLRISTLSIAASAIAVRAQEVQDIRPLVDAITHGAKAEEGGIEMAFRPSPRTATPCRSRWRSRAR